MNYLHSLQPPVIHSDLKSKNVLISENLVAKVSQCYNVLQQYVVCWLIFILRPSMFNFKESGAVKSHRYVPLPMAQTPLAM